MKLEQVNEAVLKVVVIAAGLMLAVAAGVYAGSGKLQLAVGVIGLIAVVAFFLTIRARIWLVIPACWQLGAQISALPLPFSIAQLGILFAFGTFLLLKAFKVIRIKPSFERVDLAMLIMLVYLLTVFIRNPTGMEALGSDRVGGKHYFGVAVAYAGYWVLSRSVATPKDAFLLPLLMVASQMLHSFLNIVTLHFPSTVGPISKLYSGLVVLDTENIEFGSFSEASRQTYLQGLGVALFQAICSYFRPMTVINPFYIFRFLLFLIAVAAILLSGFRSAVVAVIGMFIIGTYLRDGMTRVVQSLLLGAALLSLIVFCQGRLFQLPFSAQRTLSFLPGLWDPSARSQAEGSTEWRVEMWKAMLTSDRYIENKWLGDGFGFTRRQLDIMLANQKSGTIADQQENFMISGGVHSGPVGSIRFVGYVGLALFLGLMAIVSLNALRLIKQAKGTPFFTMAMFLGIPAVMAPVIFVFIFGAFETDFANVIVLIGFQKMTENSLRAYALAHDKSAPLIKPAQEQRGPRRFAPVPRAV